MTDRIEIVMNGKPQLVAKGLSVSAWADALEVPVALLLIEHNRRALHREEWASTFLRPGDQLEILKIAAGG